MSVAIIAQGGAVLGYMVKNMKNAKAKELCIPSFVSVLFGITEPALFGVNIRYRYPLAGGCIGGAVGGAIVYITNLAALGFGTTVVPGIALADPTHNGYINYAIAHIVALGTGFFMTLILGMVFGKKTAVDITEPGIIENNTVENIHSENRKIEKLKQNEIGAYADGELIPIEEVSDATFAQKVLGDGMVIIPDNGNVYAPFDAEVAMVTDTGHAIGLTDKNGNQFLIHIGIDTVNLNGKYFQLQVTTGDQVKMGDILAINNLDKIKEEGYDMSVLLIATDINEKKIKKESPRKVKNGEKIAQLI